MVFSEESGQEVLLAQPGGKIIVRSEYRDVLLPGWFDPGFWHERAVAVSSGGRGSAWFIDGGMERWVLRHYRRGGLVAKLNRGAYLFAGESSVRSFSEFRLLTYLYGAGLPVPRPVAARYRRYGVIAYQAEILLQRIVGAAPFADQLMDAEAGLWRKVGSTIRQFHDLGVYHADLNCHNILVAGTDPYLIDFDKGEIRPNSAPGCSWKMANLERLKRSLRKNLEAGNTAEVFAQGWRQLQYGYTGR